MRPGYCPSTLGNTMVLCYLWRTPRRVWPAAGPHRLMRRNVNSLKHMASSNIVQHWAYIDEAGEDQWHLGPVAFSLYAFLRTIPVQTKYQIPLALCLIQDHFSDLASTLGLGIMLESVTQQNANDPPWVASEWLGRSLCPRKTKSLPGTQ